MKPIMESLLRKEPLARDAIIVILDWIDKVRTGLRTLYYLLDDNLAGIDPLFAIDQRVRLKDRMLIITRSSDLVEDLTYRGCNAPSFYYTPSVFSLMVNDISLTSVSYSLFLAKELGLPYPTQKQLTQNNELICTMAAGSEVLVKPSIGTKIGIPYTRIYQPIWREWNRRELGLYNTDYVLNLSLNPELGLGIPILERDSICKPFPNEPTIDWLPPVGPRTVVSRYLLSKAVLKMQTDIDELAPDFSLLDEEARLQFQEILETNKIYNSRTVAQITKSSESSILRNLKCTARGFWDIGLNPTPPRRPVEAAGDGTALA